MKKFVKRLTISIMLAIIGLLIIAVPVFAVPSNVTGFNANPSNTSIILSWQPATGATSYVVRYRTDTFPTSPANGTSAYSGVNTMCTVLGLSAGQSYYFAVWGYDGADYSTVGTTIVSTTLSIFIPSGGTTTGTNAIPIPTIPASANQSPTTTQFVLRPFDAIIAWSNNASIGGLGMPTENLWEVIAIFITVLVSLLTYIRVKNFFIAYLIMLLLSALFVGLKLMQGFIIPIELAIGAGVWALERFFQ